MRGHENDPERAMTPSRSSPQSLLSPRQATTWGVGSVVGEAEHRKLKALVKDLQRDLEHSQAEGRKLNDKIQKLVQSKEDQVANSQMVAHRFRQELDEANARIATEEVQVQRLRGRSSELQAALEEEVGGRQKAERLLKIPCSDCHHLRLRISELSVEKQSLQSELRDAEEKGKLEAYDLKQENESQEMRHKRLVASLRKLVKHHEHELPHDAKSSLAEQGSARQRGRS
eukprot:TRINITY_DN19744_c0_g1_i1.p1 TRINITY_DN19744_c0_g1~~TRINITY_DN19744_c0_g1_i1.p1  ORF type:complete len:229 (+),score=56.79 TRINITY_DN19744_c0_g1_i1:398-1084(+)